LVLLPAAWGFYRLQLRFRRTSVDLQRLESVTRSPLQAFYAETVSVAVTYIVFY
jgi:hypothetical protein